MKMKSQGVTDISFLNEFEGLKCYGDAHDYMFRYKRVSKKTFALVLYSLKFNTSDWMLVNAKTEQDVKRVIEKEWVHNIGEGINFGEGIMDIHYCYEYPDIMNRIRAVEDFAREYKDSDLEFGAINLLVKNRLSEANK